VAARFGGHASKADAPAAELKEEEHVQPSQPGGLDAEEVTLEADARPFAQKLTPTRPGTPRRRLDAAW